MNFMIFKISIRYMVKHKIYSYINVLGLALGFTAFILIGLFIRFELSLVKSNNSLGNMCITRLFESIYQTIKAAIRNPLEALRYE